MSTWNRVSKSVTNAKRKFFTIEQANKTLVLLRKIVGEIIEQYDNLLQIEELIEFAEETRDKNNLSKYRKKLVCLVDNVQECLEELQLIGVSVRDFKTGTVDFPARYNGREISLCWTYGEPSVSYWHEINTGLAAREELESLAAS